MAKNKEEKTNAMRILERMRLPYRVNYYQCDAFTDGMQIAAMLGQSPEQTFKTLVAEGKSGDLHVFVLPVNRELDMKAAAREAGEKNVSLLHVKDIKAATGYIRGGCTAIGMKKPYPVVIHESAMAFEEIIVSGGALGVQLFLTPEVFLRATGAKTADIILHDVIL